MIIYISDIKVGDVVTVGGIQDGVVKGNDPENQLVTVEWIGVKITYTYEDLSVLGYTVLTNEIANFYA